MSNHFIGIMANDSPQLLVGLLGILKSGHAFVPLNPTFPAERIHFIIKDCNIRCLLTDKANYSKGYEIARVSPVVTHLLCLDDGTVAIFTGKTGTARKTLQKEEFCYVIYTSGTMGKPKGVPIQHRNLVSLFFYSREYLNLGRHTRVMHNLSYTFDFGVFEIFTTLLFGGLFFILDKSKINNFSCYVRFIDCRQINTLHTTPVFINNLAGPGKIMSSLRLIHLGGEQLTGNVIMNIVNVINPICCLYNGYGPTEATINCTYFLLSKEKLAENIKENTSIGRPCDWHEIYIMDRFLNPQPIGAAGELCIAGPGLSPGYLNRPELTSEKFGPQITLMSQIKTGIDKSFFRGKGGQNSVFSKKAPLVYRTGDLARWSTDGNIHFLGRIDQQVKVRGFRIELGEIESCLALYPAVKETFVTLRKIKEDEHDGNYLCAYFISRTPEHPTGAALRNFLSTRLPDYMIPAYFIPLEKFPVTANGKIDRKALPEPGDGFISTGSEYSPPVTGTEKKLVLIWQGLLALKRIGIHDDFFQAGGDSILVNRCIARIREELHSEIPLRKFFERPFIKALAEEIDSQNRQVFSIKPAERVGAIPLSFAQERLWFLQELDAGNTAYFVPRVIRMKGKLDISLMEQTFTGIIRRHEILRTVFPTVNGQPVQRILPPYLFKIPVLDWSALEKEAQEQTVSEFLSEEGRRPFDFEKGPLLRVTILKLKEEEHLFVLTEHHLVHDGWTQGVLLREFIAIYSAYAGGKEHCLPPLPIQYADFAIWQRHYLTGEVMARHLGYWQEKLAGLEPVLELPADRPRPPVISGKGELEIVRLPGPYTHRLKEFSRKNGVTLFMTMLAVFKTLLYRYTGVKDLCVGTGVANRRYREMEGMLGMVINTLPLRTQLEGEISFKECLKRVKESCLEAYQHEDTPFGKIVEVMQPERNLSYMPIFQVLFSFMDTPGERLWLPGLELELLPSHNRSAKFDINIVAAPPPGHEESENAETLVEWEYNTDIYDSSTIQRMISHYNRLLEESTAHPETVLANLALMSEAEIKQVLYEFNDTETVYPREKAIQQLFEEGVERMPDRTALVGADKGEEKKRRREEEKLGGMYLSYRELNERSGQLAGLLLEKGVLPDSIVGIMMERSSEMIIGIMGILKAGAAYLPIDPEYPQERIEYILKDSRATILITDNKKDIIVNDQLSIVNCQLLINALQAPRYHHSSFIDQHSNLAYIIYTSGSTGQPRGVMVTHRNVTRLVKNTNFVSLTEETRILQTGAPVFDATTFEIWGSLLNGGRLVLVDKESILDPYRLGNALKKHRINTLWLSAPLFNRLQQQDSDLFAPLSYLLVGGDILSPDHINCLHRQFPYLKIINGYGPTENTTFSTTYLIEKEFEQSIPIGRPIANSTAYICDKNLQLLPVGIWGELYVGGDGVSRGYLNNPELSATRFILPSGTGATRNPFEKGFLDFPKLLFNYPSPLTTYHSPFTTHHSPLTLHHSPITTYHSPLYKTGDLVKWLPDGNIEFLGRIDQQVKIRGFRVELGEIESRLLKHGQVKEAVVIDRKNGAEKYLCAYIVPLSNQVPGVMELKDYLSKRLPGYMIPAFFAFIERIPLNANGKIDRKALPDPANGANGANGANRKGAKGYIAPRDIIEKQLAEIWAEVLKPGSPPGIDDHFFDLGGHSLNATRLITRMHKTFNVKIPLKEFFQKGCIREVAEYIKKAVTEEFRAVEPVEKQEYYPLSPAQKRLYVLQQMNETGVAYNIPAIMKLEGKLDKNHLEGVFKQLIHRHESLRTSFITLDGAPVQRIHDTVDFTMEYNESGIESLGFFYESFTRAFDLAQAPLIRVALVKEEDEKHLLLLDMHHIITDGASMELLIKEFMVLYEENELPPLRLQYKDYSQGRSSEQEKKGLNVQEEYWLRQFSQLPAVLNLPLDFPRPVVQSFAGRGYPFEITAAETGALKALASSEGTTLYMVLLTIYYIFLTRITGQEDIVIGTPVSGRSHADLELIIGMFVNSLALRNNPAGEKNVSDFLKEVNDNTLAAFANQDYPYEELVEKVVVHRDTGRNPLLDTMLNLRNMELSEIKIPGLTMSPFPYEENIAKFDLTLRAFDGPENLRFNFVYCTKLFQRASIGRFIMYFKNIIKDVLKDKFSRIFELEIIPEEERRRLLFDFNDVTGEFGEFPIDKTICQLFMEQALRIPNAVAAVDETKINMHLSYGELNERSGKLAGLLTEKGVQAETIAGVMMERGIDLILSLLGILKAGGAYLPIDPNYPRERIEYILKDSGMKLLINKSEIRISKFETNPNVQKINDQNKNFKDLMVLDFEYLNFEFVSDFDIRASNLNSSNLAYIIYTSGTTGRPKGTAIRHNGVTNLIYFHRIIFKEDQDSRVSQAANPAFDAMGFEVWPCLAGGSALYIVDNETRLSSAQMRDWLIRRGITITFQPTVMAEHLLEEWWPSEGVMLKSLCAAGDKLNRYPGRAPALPFKLYNLYGPTEDTVWTTWALVEPEPDPVSRVRSPVIGKPIANHCIYILNSYLKLQPIGIPGELCISGIGIARGYLNNPELTAERFGPQITLITQMSLIKTEIDKSFFRGSRGAVFSKKAPLVYKTGDLARWLDDGNIEFLGRIDHQVKIRGFRIELGEIENRLSAYSKIKDAVVITKGDQLCAYFTADGEIDSSELREYLAAALPDYMIPAYLVQLDIMPLNPNGKLDRKALPEPAVKKGERFAAPRTEIEKEMAVLWAEILGRPQTSLGIDDHFFQLGGHSLKATVLAAKIHMLWSVKVPLMEIFKTPRIRELSEYIRNAVPQLYEQIAPAEKKDYYTLSSAQKRLFFLQQMDPETTAYHISAAWVLEGVLDRNRLAGTFEHLVKRHESFRTSFVIAGKEPVQRVHNEVEFGIEYKDLATEDTEKTENIERKIRSFIRPFDLAKAPLLRVGLVTLAKEKYILLVDMPHIISDGLSAQILIRDFSALYQGQELPDIKRQYTDYAEWQNRERRGNKIQEQGEYWQKEFAGEIPLLDLPADYSRPTVQDFAGDRISFEVGGTSAGILKGLALESGATLYIILLALYNIFLAKLSGLEDIVVGSPVAGRRHADLEKIMGMFVNTLALRNHPVGEKKWYAFLAEVKEKTLKAFENQDYPYEELVEKISLNRDTGRNPLFDTMFDLQNTGSEKVVIPGLKLVPLVHENKTAKFDLSLSVVEEEDTLLFTFEYRTKLFCRATIERFAGYFKQLIYSVSANDQKDATIAAIEILTAGEMRQLVHDFNNNEAPCFAGKTLPQLFMEQVEKSPDRIALVGADLRVCPNCLTYGELNEKSGELAASLIEKGVRADDPVGIMTKPSLEMAIGLWGILKAGGAYLPIDPEYPIERINYMLKDSNAKILINKSEIRNPKSETNSNVQITNDQNNNQYFGTLSVLNFENLNFDIVSNFDIRASNFNSSNLAYIIYTSGTTGRPKGVMVEHRNLASYVQFFAGRFMVRDTDVAAQQASFTFDAFVEEFYPVLVKGGKIVLFPREVVREIDRFADLINRFGITIISTSPLLTAQLNRLNRTPGVRLYAIGGDVLKKEYIDNLLKTSAVHNGYGPTEATVCATFYDCSEATGTDGGIPIGKPIPGSRVYILNRYKGLQPVGVPGECCIGGAGVTRGYVNQPELTAKKFGPLITQMAQMTLIKTEIDKSFFGGSRGAVFSKKAPLVYKTGDLARWLPDGNIEFLGRIDEQVKIRGFRIELGEIENRLLNQPKIKQAVVLALGEQDEDKYLCAYVVTDAEIVPAELRESLAKELPYYMIPSYFVMLDKIPLTSSGKPDRKKLPGPVMNTTGGYGGCGGYIPPRNEIEEKMVNVWNDILCRKGLPGSPSDRTIGIGDNFFHVGGDSIKAIHVAARLKEYDLNLKINDLFLHPVISELSAFVTVDTKDQREKETAYGRDISPGILSRVQRHIQAHIGGTPGIEAVYSLTPMQKTMLYHDLGGANKDVFFIQLLTRWEGTIDPGILKASVQKLVERHGVYRTVFIYEGLDEPLQAVLTQRDVEFVFQDISGWPEEQRNVYLAEFREKDIKRGFDVTKDMLLRVALIKMNTGTYYLVRSSHYILEDGWCTATVFGDLYRIYESLRTGAPLELPEPAPYRRYIDWLEKQDKAAGLRFWQDYLAGYEHPGDLIPVVPGKSAADNPYQFKEYSFIIGETDIRHLKRLAVDCQATLNIVFQTLWGFMLQVYNNRDDVVFGAVVSGRTPEIAGIETMVGLLINSVPVRVKSGPGWLFSRLLKQVQAKSIAAKAYEYLPLTEILAACNLKANIIDSLMTFQNFLMAETGAAAAAVTGNDRHGVPAFRAETSLFHQSNYNFNIIINPQSPFEIKFMYNAAVHDEIFCRRIEQHFKEIIRQIIANNDIALKDIRVTYDYIAADIRLSENEEDEWNM